MQSWTSLSVPKYRVEVASKVKIWDTEAQSIAEVSEKDIKLYVCGITPYDATHMGHAATYLTFDLLQRLLIIQGRKVSYVQNITDVDDPLLERAIRDNLDWRDLATKEIELFKDDMSALRVLPPRHYIGAVEAIPLVVKAIEKLISKNAVYKIDKDLYFDISTDLNFGDRSHLSIDEMIEIFAQRGGDPTLVGKRNKLDCLLWRAHREGEPSWDSPFGAGRPGWHIECTAIALEYLGSSITIQGGGSDLIFPHHEMCAAQGEVMNNATFAQYFMHTGMIGYQGEKMSKSKGNLVFVSKLREAGIDAMAIRLALLANHYRSDREWDDALLQNATERLDRWRKGFAKPEGPEIEETISGVVDALNNDLDTTKALAHIDSWVEKAIADSNSEKNSKLSNSGTLARFVDSILGIAL
ncbi:MAG: cysteine--1-D-myo-inosityl 2-amino-2-deoxy-alpha-D-glucopyranoside ligase [Actinobacteria bacterium]|uniref:L-cysteine:1D-myo-inositol 2-amino-2-deoxy-alpha-D-glucopyranoside ligase n=1 Tax=freshwater metagenome TaxID=449393 RepID=A0A6J6MTT2_9ZZZZ|nr:cysteine--1-D-myo-inosityl 2-amino-2-deoxy-alpha-D-glucopyranoside ligase [Actinomycetota bacterium]MSY66944.1 cysteine--1-D-myo-inosityl 2-amino-2-deoxy-alpha-D-glucopyranoside ligase [Actinomycetota bacterium]MTA00372.1 cysteine--1-D-myo-inosityl 2-amino-2-deoxy-alpha-D-glucopyranoside ligase [Actinomycetota bacterium]